MSSQLRPDRPSRPPHRSPTSADPAGTPGISFGLTTLTLGWVGSYLPVRPAIGWIAAGLLCGASTYEVAWVVVQHARGVPAHFNDMTTLDENLFVLGAVMVAIAILVIAAMTLTGYRHWPQLLSDLARRLGTTTPAKTTS